MKFLRKLHCETENTPDGQVPHTPFTNADRHAFNLRRGVFLDDLIKCEVFVCETVKALRDTLGYEDLGECGGVNSSLDDIPSLEPDCGSDEGC